MQEIFNLIFENMFNGLYLGFEIIKPYVIGTVVIVLIGTIIKAIFNKIAKIR